jgi:hypothetical protein
VYCPQYRESVGAGIEAADRIQKAFIVRTIELLPEGHAYCPHHRAAARRARARGLGA